MINIFPDSTEKAPEFIYTSRLFPSQRRAPDIVPVPGLVTWFFWVSILVGNLGVFDGETGS